MILAEHKADADKLILNKFSLLIVSRCNLTCDYCSEYVPNCKSNADMDITGADAILSAFFGVVDRLVTLHIAASGEPLLHKQLPELIDICFKYSSSFDKLMAFTNGTIFPNEATLERFAKHKDRIIVQISLYGIDIERESRVVEAFTKSGCTIKTAKYYGDDQEFGGWVDFGSWESYGRTDEELSEVFKNCAITRDMLGNWRTRDGKMFWCSRAHRGYELGFLSVNEDDYVDLFGSDSRDEKRAKIRRITNCSYITACDHCSGDQGTRDPSKRIKVSAESRCKKRDRV